jgi:hypothetical protein
VKEDQDEGPYFPRAGWTVLLAIVGVFIVVAFMAYLFLAARFAGVF